MAKGLLYFAQNSAFQHLTKIGKTTKLAVENRGLSASNVPEDFGYLAVLECDDIDWAEKKVHEQFASFRHYTQTRRKTEFFWSGCVENAIKYAKDLKGVFDKTENETEEIEVIVDGGEKQTKKVATKTTFKMLQIPKGTKVYFKNDKTKQAIVLDDKNKVEYQDKPYSLSTLAVELNKEQGGTASSLNGFWFFFFDDERLYNLRPDQQDKE